MTKTKLNIELLLAIIIMLSPLFMFSRANANTTIEQLVYTRGGGIQLSSPNDASRLKSISAAATQLDVSPNGQTIAYTSGGTVRTVGVDGSNDQEVINEPTYAHYYVYWNSDGSELLTVRSNGSNYDFRMYNTTTWTGTTIGTEPGSPIAVVDPVLSSDDSTIYYGRLNGGTGNIYEMTVADGSTSQLIANSSDALLNLALSPDGTTLAYTKFPAAGSGYVVYTALAADGTGEAALTGTILDSGGTADYDIAWSPDGSQLAIISGNAADKSIYLINSDGSGSMLLIDTNENIDSIDWFSTTINSQVSDGKQVTTVNSTSDYSNVDFTLVTNDHLVANGTVGDVIIGDGAKLMGIGTTGNIVVNSGGILAPGESPGCLASGDLSLVSGATFEVEIDGNTVCAEYDQQQVTGTVSLGDATLDIQKLASFTPVLGDEFIIIDNDGADAVTGTFLNYAEGSTRVVDGIIFQITYEGGDGNDVVLSVTDSESIAEDDPAAPDTGFAILFANPITTFALTTVSALAIVVLARKSVLQK